MVPGKRSTPKIPHKNRGKKTFLEIKLETSLEIIFPL